MSNEIDVTNDQLNDAVERLKARVKVLNSTVYETDDLLKVVVLAEMVKPNIYVTKQIKFRYMNSYRDTRCYNYETSEYSSYSFGAARIKPLYWGRGADRLEMAIVRPKKIKTAALQWLAASATADYLSLPSEIVRDFVSRLSSDTYRDTRTNDTTETIIKMMSKLGIELRMNNKAKERKDYTLAKLQERVTATENSISKKQADIQRYLGYIEYAERRISKLEKDLEQHRKRVEEFKKKKKCGDSSASD